MQGKKRTMTYSPGGKVPFFGFILMLITGAIGAVAGSFIYFLFQRHLCIPIFFLAIGIGFLVGWFVGIGITWGKVRSEGVAGALGAAFGVATSILILVWGLRDLQTQVIDYAAEEFGTRLSQSRAADIVEDLLEDETGSSGLWGYLLFTASEGEQTFYSMDSSGIDELVTLKLPSWVSIGLDGIDYLLIIGVSWATAVSHALRRFCERHGSWYKREVILETDAADAEKVLVAFREGNVEGLAALEAPESGKKSVMLAVEWCPAGDEGVVVLEAGSGILDHKELASREVNAPERANFMHLKEAREAHLEAEKAAKKRAREAEKAARKKRRKT